MSNLDVIHDSWLDNDDMDEEEKKKWNLNLQNAFDDLDDDSLQEHFSSYSVSQSLKSDGEDPIQTYDNSDLLRDCRRKLHAQAVQKKSVNYDECNALNVVSSTESEKSNDVSVNIITKDSIIKSPVQFHINLSNVVSHTDESISDYDQLSYLDDNCAADPFSANFDEYNNKGNYFNTSDRNKRIIKGSHLILTETSEEQLKLLYKARSQEIDYLHKELNQVRLASKQEILFLKQELAALNTDKEALVCNEYKIKCLLAKREGTIKNLNYDLRQRDKQLRKLELENKRLKLQPSESCIKSSLAKEEYIKKLKNSNYKGVRELNVTSTTKQVDKLEHETEFLKENLFTASKLFDMMVKENSVHTHLLGSDPETLDQLMETVSNSPFFSDCTTLEKATIKCQCSEYENRDLEMHDMLAKLGFFKSIFPFLENTPDQAGLDKALTSDKLRNAASSSPETKTELNRDSFRRKFTLDKKIKQEVFKVLLINKLYHERVNQMITEISKKEEIIQILETELKSLKESSEYFFKASHTNEKKKFLNSEDDDACSKEKCVVMSYNTEGIQEYENPKKVFFQAKELENESLLAHSKWNFLEKGLENLTKYLNIFQNDDKLKAFPDSSDMRAFKDILNTLLINSKQIKEVVRQLYLDNIQLESKIQTLTLNLEKIKTENWTLKTKDLSFKSGLEEKYKIKTFENSNEETITEINRDIHNEYNDIIIYLKEEFGKVSNELIKIQSNYKQVYQERNILEEIYTTIFNEKAKLCEEVSGASMKQWNNKNIVDNFSMINNCAIRKYTSGDCQTNKVLNLSGNENSGIYEEVKCKCMYPSGRVTELESRRNVLRNKHAEMTKNSPFNKKEEEIIISRDRLDKGIEADKKNIFVARNTSSDFSLTYIMETLDVYNELINELKEENDKLKLYYEKQIEELKKTCKFNIEDIITLTEKNCEDTVKEEFNLLKSNVTRLSTEVRYLEEKKHSLQELHNQDLNKFRVQLQYKENEIFQIRKNYEYSINKLTTSLHELNIENSQFKEYIKTLEESVDNHIQKYLQLKKKCSKLKSNLEKLHTWVDESAEKYQNCFYERKNLFAKNCQLKKNTERGQKEIDGIKVWLAKWHFILNKGILQVITELKSLIEKVPFCHSLDSPINILMSIHKHILNLDIKNTDQKLISST